MRIALIYGPINLTFRGTMDFDAIWDDPRGLTGSELGCIRIAEELAKKHDVTIYTESNDTKWGDVSIRPTDKKQEIGPSFDAAISINEPDMLRGCRPKLRVCEYWLNGFTQCKVGFNENVDLWTSPSQPHMDMVLGGTWGDVELVPEGPRGHYDPDPEQWSVNMLGCDPEQYDPSLTVPGRCVYASSPDRGLHLLLQEWPRIKRAAPEAHLKIFYRLGPWLAQWDQIAYFPPIEEQRQRALYIEEALRRMSGPEWAIEVCDSVSRKRIAKELSEASVLAYPCDTTQWSEGFSCTILEACAAGAVPVISDCDALGEIYKDSGAVVKERGRWREWSAAVSDMLAGGLAARRDRVVGFASQLTWAAHTERLDAMIQEKL